MPDHPSQPHYFHFDQAGKDWDSMDSIEIHRHYSVGSQREVKPAPFPKDPLTPSQPGPKLDTPKPDTPKLSG
jgi:hypothetical protein